MQVNGEMTLKNQEIGNMTSKKKLQNGLSNFGADKKSKSLLIPNNVPPSNIGSKASLKGSSLDLRN